MIIRNAAREDAEAVARNLGIFDRDARNILSAVSQGKGGLRKVALAIEAAGMLARGGEITGDLIRKVAGATLQDGGK